MPLSLSGDQGAICYFWDEGVEPKRLAGKLIHNDASTLLGDYKLKSNHLRLDDMQLQGPDLSSDGENTYLWLAPSFDFHFITDQQAAGLGVIHLVQSRRFAVLEDGTEYPLLETDDNTVLYLTADDDEVVKPVITLQDKGLNQSYNYGCTVSQMIPDEIAGQAVTSLTVLEQYTSYFMQHPLPQGERASIWLPVYAPISWGWSIRVARRFDGDWSIQRRKLILPTCGHEGTQLPLWKNNSRACAHAVMEGAL